MTATYLPLVPDSTEMVEIPTIKDLVDFVLVHGALDEQQNSARNVQLARESAAMAYQQLVASHAWRWFKRTFVFSTSARVQVSDATYTASTNTFTITAGTAPSWARDGVVHLRESPQGELEISRVVSGADDVIYLRGEQSLGSNGTYDIDIARRRYPLPIDFKSDKSVYNRTTLRPLSRFLHAEEHMSGAWSRSEPDEPVCFQIRAGSSPFYKVLELSPPSLEAQTISVAYESGGRPLRTYELGRRVTIAQNSSTVTFDVAVPSSAIGSVLRIGASNDDDLPTSATGAHPWYIQRILIGVSGTTGTLDTAVSEAISDRQAILSDPLDLDPMVLLPAVKTWAQYEYGRNFRSDDGAKTTFREVQAAVGRAMEANTSAPYAQVFLDSRRLATIEGGYDQWEIP